VYCKQLPELDYARNLYLIYSIYWDNTRNAWDAVAEASVITISRIVQLCQFLQLSTNDSNSQQETQLDVDEPNYFVITLAGKFQ